ncbi:phosphodiester glycosidase family protein [Acinetobacter sp. GXMZU3951]
MQTRFGVLCKIILLCCSVFSAASWAEINVYKQQFKGYGFTVIEVRKFAHLRLFLNQRNSSTALHYFDQISTQLKPCEQMTFAMNAGMFHSTYHPVGLYIENKKKLFPINRDHGWGNFYLQPNGVFAWNATHAIILSTSQYTKRKFKADYATQSGPMLIRNKQINPIFIPQSDSLKLRNAVGIKSQTLYFVLTEQPVNFYTLASFMRDDLELEQALYLDGSVSAVYLSEPPQNTQTHRLGPMLAYIDDQACHSNSQ